MSLYAQPYPPMYTSRYTHTHTYTPSLPMPLRYLQVLFSFLFCLCRVSINLPNKTEGGQRGKKTALCFLETSSLCLTSHLRLNLWQGGRLRQRQYPSSREAPSYTLPLRSPWRTRCRTFSTNHAVFSHPRWRKAFLRSELHPHTLVEARTTRSHQAFSCSCTFVFWGAENDFVPRIYLEKHM